MKDEEIEKKAKEYAKGNFYSEQGFLYGYEIGLEEGRKEKWHGLRKNPNDVPTEYKEVLVNLWDENNYCIGSYNKKYDEWEFNEFTLSSDRRFEIIAWCELPQFKG